MLSEYFGLVLDPFERDPDPRFLYMDGVRRNAFAQLLSSVYECKGTVVLAGEEGLGKSTLIRHLAEQLAALDSVLVLYPGGVLNCRSGMSFPAILGACRGRFDRRSGASSDEERLTATLERAAGHSQVAVLLLDDADTLDDITLARLGKLSEPDIDDRRLISVILAGSPLLAKRLESIGDQSGRALSIDLFVQLQPLRDRDVDRLIHHRLTVAGHDGGELFSPVAIAEIARRSRGNPMHINALCSASLALARRESKSTVSRDLVDRAAEQVPDGELDVAAPAAAKQAIRSDDWNVAETDRERSAERAGAPVEPRPSMTAKRLDDVAEAIRAADMRSSGGADPHIKYGPYSPGPGLGEDDARDRQPAYETRAAPVDDGYRLYPGDRPSGSPRRKRRGRLVKAAVIGLMLVALVGGGIYLFRSGRVSVGGLEDQVTALTATVVRMVQDAIEPDAALDDELPAAGSPPGDGAKDTATTDLDFERFGGLARDRRSEPGGPYNFAPPPPHGGVEPPAETPSSTLAAKPDVVPAPPPAASPPGAETDAEAGPTAAGAAPPPQAPQPAADTARAGPEDFDLLDPATAVILSRKGPQPAPKPSPPPAPAGNAAAAQTAPAVAASPPKPAEPASRTAKPEAERAQVQPLLSRGDEYLGSGDLDMARTFYQMAYDRGSAEAAIRMGWTFDPQYFQRIGLRGEASPREAILWYQEALRRGSRQASERLSDLATWLQNAASAGDVEAQRILRLWQG